MHLTWHCRGHPLTSPRGLQVALALEGEDHLDVGVALVGVLQASFGLVEELQVSFDLVAGELLVSFGADLVGAHQVSFDPAFAARERRGASAAVVGHQASFGLVEVLLASFVGLVEVSFDPAAGELQVSFDLAAGELLVSFDPAAEVLLASFVGLAEEHPVVVDLVVVRQVWVVLAVEHQVVVDPAVEHQVLADPAAVELLVLAVVLAVVHPAWVVDLAVVHQV